MTLSTTTLWAHMTTTRRTPRQKAASRRNLEKARAAKKHSITLYHFTSPQAAKSILKSQTWNPGHRKAWKSLDPEHVYFTNKLKGSKARDFGPWALSVRVPTGALRRDTWEGFKINRENLGKERHYAVALKSLKGRRIRRAL